MGRLSPDYPKTAFLRLHILIAISEDGAVRLRRIQRWKFVLALMLVVTFARPVMAQKKRFINWNSLKNPVLSYPNWSVKDTAMVYRDGHVLCLFLRLLPGAGTSEIACR